MMFDLSHDWQVLDFPRTGTWSAADGYLTRVVERATAGLETWNSWPHAGSAVRVGTCTWWLPHDAWPADRHPQPGDRWQPATGLAWTIQELTFSPLRNLWKLIVRRVELSGPAVQTITWLEAESRPDAVGSAVRHWVARPPQYQAVIIVGSQRPADAPGIEAAERDITIILADAVAMNRNDKVIDSSGVQYLVMDSKSPAVPGDPTVITGRLTPWRTL